VLALLYRNCRANVNKPNVTLLDLEGQMGFPREYLDFTVWYLRSKKYVKQEDNARVIPDRSGRGLRGGKSIANPASSQVAEGRQLQP
jgi:hypothetical protein